MSHRPRDARFRGLQRSPHSPLSFDPTSRPGNSSSLTPIHSGEAFILDAAPSDAENDPDDVPLGHGRLHGTIDDEPVFPAARLDSLPPHSFQSPSNPLRQLPPHVAKLPTQPTLPHGLFLTHLVLPIIHHHIHLHLCQHPIVCMLRLPSHLPHLSRFEVLLSRGTS